MDAWISYIKEEENKEVLQVNGSFIAYQIIDNECYVTDFFVPKSERGKGVGLFLAKELVELAKEKKCSHMTCNIFIKPHNADAFAHKVRLFTKFGFKPIGALNNSVQMIKEI